MSSNLSWVLGMFSGMVYTYWWLKIIHPWLSTRRVRRRARKQGLPDRPTRGTVRFEDGTVQPFLLVETSHRDKFLAVDEDGERIPIERGILHIDVDCIFPGQSLLFHPPGGSGGGYPNTHKT
ncbi:MAG TPA: hypothetical protein VK735_39715 [Pseudonocardia sp.]|uniref:hypothetical protein n=1 Tax=Pseudonocardia sp. TaxID=60912 RepID=UPI002BAD9AD3|nr:hypothetical protein [Pseudonocardia sp.]HTF53611.1 hypothetical protein [Pseudonocardia sp.]